MTAVRNEAGSKDGSVIILAPTSSPILITTNDPAMWKNGSIAKKRSNTPSKKGLF